MPNRRFSIELNFPVVQTTVYNSVEVSSISKSLNGASVIELKMTTTENDLLVVLPLGDNVIGLEPNIDEILKFPGRALIITGIAPPESGTQNETERMDMAPLEPDWAGLPKHLLDLIHNKLDFLSDHVRFSAVCLSWKSIAMHNKNQLHSKTSIPLLMIPTKDSSKKKRSLYSVTHQKVHDFQLSVPYNKRCCGSSHGWLVFFNKRVVAPILFNPFLNKTIHLPRLETEGYNGRFAIAKIVLSANPATTIMPPNEDYVVASIYGDMKRLAFYKRGDKSWTYINKKFYPFKDVIFYQGRMLAVDTRRRVVSVDVLNNQVKIITPAIPNSKVGHVYLVESSAGDLLMVQKIFYCVDGMSEPEIDKYDCMTETFEVSKLVLDDQTGMVVDKIEVKSLGEETLFLGDNSSMSILASKDHGLKQNSIYYTDDYTLIEKHVPRDIGIFSLEDRSMHQHYLLNPSQKHMPPPIWIVPTLL